MKVAILTAGGLAPCLSASIGALLDNYTKEMPEAELFGYLYGYQGLLKGDLFQFSTVDIDVSQLFEFGGSLLGNSRVKLTNTEDCIRRGLVADGESPLEVAAQQLQKDEINILHTVGGDDTNTMAAALSNYLLDNNYKSVSNLGYNFPNFKHFPRLCNENEIAAVEIHKEINSETTQNKEP